MTYGIKLTLKESTRLFQVLIFQSFSLVCSAFNHWQSFEAQRNEVAGASFVNEDIFPNYVLAVHSSRPVMLEQVVMPQFCLADTFLLLATKYGKRHEVTIVNSKTFLSSAHSPFHSRRVR